MTGDPGTLEFHRSRWRHLLVLLLVPVMVGASWFAATQAGDVFHRALGWFGVVFFGAATFPIVLGLLRGGVAVTMDSYGITDKRMGTGTIPWSEVTECFVTEVHHQKLLCLRLRNPDLFYQELPLRNRMLVAANRRLGFGDVTLAFHTLRPSLPEALDFIRRLGSIPVR